MDAPFVQDEEGNIYDVLLNEDAPSPDEKLLSVSLRIEIERTLNKLTRRGRYYQTFLRFNWQTGACTQGNK